MRQFKNAAHRAAADRAKSAFSYRAKLLDAVHRHAVAEDPTEAEAMRLRSLGLLRSLLTAERNRYHPPTTAVKSGQPLPRS